MKKLFLIISICASLVTFSQKINKEIFCSLQFKSSGNPFFVKSGLSSFAKALPDSISNWNQLNALGANNEFIDIIEAMSNLGWAIHSSTTYPANKDEDGFVLYVYKKQISYTEEMLERLRKLEKEELKKYKYFPD